MSKKREVVVETRISNLELFETQRHHGNTAVRSKIDSAILKLVRDNKLEDSGYMIQEQHDLKNDALVITVYGTRKRIVRRGSVMKRDVGPHRSSFRHRSRESDSPSCRYLAYENEFPLERRKP